MLEALNYVNRLSNVCQVCEQVYGWTGFQRKQCGKKRNCEGERMPLNTHHCATAVLYHVTGLGIRLPALRNQGPLTLVDNIGCPLAAARNCCIAASAHDM